MVMLLQVLMQSCWKKPVRIVDTAAVRRLKCQSERARLKSAAFTHHRAVVDMVNRVAWGWWHKGRQRFT